MAGGHSLNIKQGPGPRNRSHPDRVRPGQLFFPRHGDHRLRLVVKSVEGEWVRVMREDGYKGGVSLDRLLARDEAGAGLHYRFHGWKHLPRGYRTELVVAWVSAERGRCGLVLPEWDPDTEVEVLESELPAVMRRAGAAGTCRADLTAQSVAALEVHSCSTAAVKGVSRARVGSHPEVLAGGQVYRRRSDQRKYRLLDADPDSPTVPAWSGTRIVRLDVARLLATRPGGSGAHYEYLGGGVAATRERRQRRRSR